MSADPVFADTNVLLYLLSSHADKADRAEGILRQRPVISVQVLNEFASVSRRKFGRAWTELAETLQRLRIICPVVAVTEVIHVRGIALAANNGLSICDAMIVAAAESAGCRILFSEDMQDGRRIAGLTVRNPFA